MDFSSSSSRFPPDSEQRQQQQQRDEQQQQQEILESNSAFIEKEQMFDKVVTPSDVGKLNRLVIPKQHAEKYFPLDSSSNEKGLLLNFEDRNGKSWRFRYSYWTSSQSYVMTKGWSRFVKEKRLDAGDIVSFQRGVGQFCKDRFFIDCRRRPPPPPPHFHHGGGGGTSSGVGGQIPHGFQIWSPAAAMVATPLSLHRDHVFHLPHDNYNVSIFHDNNNNNNNININHFYRHRRHHNHPPETEGRDAAVFYHQAVQAMAPPLAPSQEMVAGGGGGIGCARGVSAGKTLRLFGVDMECAALEECSEDECDVATSSTTMSSPRFRVYDGMSMLDDNNVPTTTRDFSERGKSSMSSSSMDFGT